MDEQRTTTPETDDSMNPTEAAPGADQAETIELPGPEESPAPEQGPASDESAGSRPDESTDAGSARSRPDAHQMVTQLQQMIDQLATQASPALREVAAKAAELASAAAMRAGPIAHRAAQVTDSVGQKVAARSGQVAADLRSNPDRRAGSGTDDASSYETGSGAVPKDDAA